MYEKLEKLRAEVERIKRRIESEKGRLKMAELNLQRADNEQILANVSSFNLTPEQLAEFLKKTLGEGSAPVTDSTSLDYEDEDDFEEEETDEDEEN